jgi:hypothetical protein
VFITPSNGYSKLDVNGKSTVYISGFSGKLSSVMTHSEDPALENQSTAIPIPAPVLAPAPAPAPREVGGRDGLEPTRFGDWELRGRCIDF